mmetsp:Transcript_7753/g.15834  ORF Transcript_7753/g.15834 Transcript_7753/m.15834 type:complete len:372 (+) Transcript_7753:3-1118(+)
MEEAAFARASPPSLRSACPTSSLWSWRSSPCSLCRSAADCSARSASRSCVRERAPRREARLVAATAPSSSSMLSTWLASSAFISRCCACSLSSAARELAEAWVASRTRWSSSASYCSSFSCISSLSHASWLRRFLATFSTLSRSTFMAARVDSKRSSLLLSCVMASDITSIWCAMSSISAWLERCSDASRRFSTAMARRRAAMWKRTWLPRVFSSSTRLSRLLESLVRSAMRAWEASSSWTNLVLLSSSLRISSRVELLLAAKDFSRDARLSLSREFSASSLENLVWKSEICAWWSRTVSVRDCTCSALLDSCCSLRLRDMSLSVTSFCSARTIFCASSMFASSFTTASTRELLYATAFCRSSRAAQRISD